MQADEETDVSMLPTVKWTDVKPHKTCIGELRTNRDIRAVVPEIGMIADDVGMKVLELQLWYWPASCSLTLRVVTIVSQ